MSLTSLANTCWGLLCRRESAAFRRSLRDVASVQEQRLLHYLRHNAATEWGQRFEFATIRSAAEFQRRVPLTTYDDYSTAVQRIGDGEAGVLTREPVLLLEPTSGSTAATKHVPYTAMLKGEFQRGVAPWIVDLYRHDPQLRQGQAYWSVSPVTQRNTRTRGGIPVGFEEDSQYFGKLQGALIESVLAVPPLVKQIDDIAAFQYVTLLFLLRSRSLSLVSVWNPTFLTLLLARLPVWWPQLVKDLARGQVSTPTPLAHDLERQFRALNRPDRQRARELERVFREIGEPAELHRHIWPRLRLLSCWADAESGRYATELAALLPQARLQSKGLLATEGFVSLPLTGYPGAALAIRSHFFEFIPIDAADDTARLAHQLERGTVYAVVLTTGGGLYRYQLHDLVEVMGHIDECPLLRFVGKAAHVSDYFGEKLNERHVLLTLNNLSTRHALDTHFAMVAYDETVGAYTLFVEAPNAPDMALLALGADIESALSDNFHYRYCRELEQLRELRVFRVSVGGSEAYLARCVELGQRLGDVKPVALHARSGWASALRGHFLTPIPPIHT